MLRHGYTERQNEVRKYFLQGAEPKHRVDAADLSLPPTLQGKS